MTESSSIMPESMRPYAEKILDVARPNLSEGVTIEDVWVILACFMQEKAIAALTEGGND